MCEMKKLGIIRTEILTIRVAIFRMMMMGIFNLMLKKKKILYLVLNIFLIGNILIMKEIS